MANNKSTEKRIRQNEDRRQRNRALKGRMRSAVKDFRKAVEAGDAAKSKDLLPEAVALVDSTAQKGAIHRNAAARTKSRLTKAASGL